MSDAPHEDASRAERRAPFDALLAAADARRSWLLAACVLLYLAGYSTHLAVSPDSGAYLHIARNLVEGVGYVHPHGIHTHIAPGFPYLLAPILAAVGSDAIWAVNAFMLLVGLGNVALVYWLFRLHAGRPTAVVVSTLFAISEAYFRNCFEPIADLPFLTGLLLVLVGLERFAGRRRGALGSVALVVAGIAVMAAMRTVVIVALGGIALGLAWEAVRARRFRTLALIAAVAVGGVLLARLIDPNVSGLGLTSDERLMLDLLTERLPETLHRALTENLYLLVCETASRAAIGADFGPWVNAPLGIAVMAAGIALVRVRPVWGLLFVAFGAQWLFFIVTRRYFVPLMPLVVFAWWSALLALDRRYAPRWPSAVAVTLLFVLVGFNLARDIIIVIDQHASPYLAVHGGGRYEGLDLLADAIREEAPEGSVILADQWYAEPIMLWARRRVEWWISDPVRAAPSVYAVTPLPPGLADAITSAGWTLGEPLCSVPRGAGRDPLVLVPVRRTGG